MASRGQVGLEKHFGSPVQRADRAKLFQPLSLEADDEPCDVVRRVGDVTYVPIKDDRACFREHDLIGAIVTMAGAHGNCAEGRSCSPQSLE